MIIDKIENIYKYANVHKRFARAFDFLNELIAKNVSDGRYVCANTEIENEIYAVISTNQYELKTEAVAESHRKYIDVQLVLEGEEEMLVPSLKSPNLSGEYNGKKDVEFYDAVALCDCHSVRVSKNGFAVFFTDELHAPGGAIEGKSPTVRKAVLKVLA